MKYGLGGVFFCAPAFLVALVLLFGGVRQASGEVIDTTTTWDGSSFAAPPDVATLLFGEPNLATIGQTFTVGTDNILNSFTFWLDDVGGAGEVVNFAAFVMEWDGTKATGPILFQSTARATSDPTGRVMEQFAFNTGGLVLTPSTQYVAFLNTSNFFDNIADQARVGSPNVNAYNGGEFVFLANGSDFSKVTTFAWDKVNLSPEGNFTPGLDAAFRASFSSLVGTVVIVKATLPSGGTGFGFTDDIATPNSFNLDDGQSKTFNNVTPGEYTVTESNPGTHALTDITCDDGNSTGNVSTRTATINLEAGETVTCTFTNTEAVPVDIKPQTCPNPLNTKSKGVLPVAILGTTSFDPTQVDPATVELAGVMPLSWAVEDVATPIEPFIGKTIYTCTTLGPDGIDDLVLKFDRQEIVNVLPAVNDGDVVTLQLGGHLFGNTSIVGEDVVLIKKKDQK